MLANAPNRPAVPHGLIVAAASTHSGKTVVTLGLIEGLRRRGLTVAAAKCGPDYIDPAFLARAAAAPVVNLDPWAMSADRLRGLAARQARGADLLIIEGVMGLLDGGSGGAGSTAELARMLGLPVVLVVDGRGLAQSAAAIAEGFSRMGDGAAIEGAIINRVGSERHGELVREGFRRTAVPLLGTVARDARLALPSRHLGLVQAAECPQLDVVIAAAADLVEVGVDVGDLVGLAAPLPAAPRTVSAAGLPPPGQRIAVAGDIAFGFAYAHLIEDWRAAGAEILSFSPLADEAPDSDANFVYLPGGYPELHAGALAAAGRFRAGLAEATVRGTPVYGECGGFMALGEALIDSGGAAHRMAGLLPLVTSFEKPRLALGYRRLEPLSGLPWRAPLSAHEFHYAGVVREGAGPRLFRAATGNGVPLGAIGLKCGQAMGAFVHVIDTAPDRTDAP